MIIWMEKPGYIKKPISKKDFMRSDWNEQIKKNRNHQKKWFIWISCNVDVIMKWTCYLSISTEFHFYNCMADFVIVYIDDISVFNQKWEEHRKHLDLLFLRLIQHNILKKQVLIYEKQDVINRNSWISVYHFRSMRRCWSCTKLVPAAIYQRRWQIHWGLCSSTVSL